MPSFYNWQKVLVDNAARAFETDGRERTRPSHEAELEQKIAPLEAKPAKNDGIIAEIPRGTSLQKKSLGSPEQPLGSP